MECDDSQSGETMSVISDMSLNSRGGADEVDCVLDGVQDPDMEHDIATELWDPKGDAEAEWLFDLTPPGSLQDVEEIDRLSLDSWMSESEPEEEKEEGVKRKKKVKKGNKDSATSQNVAVIDSLLQAIEDQGGFGTAPLSWIDFESATNMSSIACAPCEAAILTTPLNLNTLLTAKQSVLVQDLDEAKSDSERDQIVSELVALETPEAVPSWYHRVMHPGHISQNQMRTAKVNMVNLHGIPLGGIRGCATSSFEFYEVLRGLEWHLSGLGKDEAAFRESKNKMVMRHPAPPGGKKGKTLLFGSGVTLERAALGSIAQYARDGEGRGPFRWTVPVYELTHLVQAMYRKVREGGPELLSPSALAGITMWAMRNTDDEVRTAAPCKYHRYINEKMFAAYNLTPSHEDAFHCALYDVHSTAEKARYIALKFFPSLVLTGDGYRHVPEKSWISLPAKKNPPPQPETDRMLKDVTSLTGDAFPPHPWPVGFYEGKGKAILFDIIESYISKQRQDEAGRLAWAWYNLGRSELVVET